MRNEEWRNLAGYEGIMISSLGRLRRIDMDYIIFDPDSVDEDDTIDEHLSELPIITKRGAMLFPSFNHDGYLRLSIDGRKPVRVHNLSVETFIGPIPEKHVADHKDNNKTNNSVSNLRILSESDNIKRSTYYKRPPRKLTPDYFKECLESYSTLLRHQYNRSAARNELKIERGEHKQHLKILSRIIYERSDANQKQLALYGMLKDGVMIDPILKEALGEPSES